MTARLPRRVPGETGEPADSLLHRLGTRWGMSRDEFEGFAGFGRSQLRRGAHAGRLAAMAGVDASALGVATPRRLDGSRRVAVGAAWTDLSDTAGRRLRLCGACLEEDRGIAAEGSKPVAVAAWCRPEWSVKSVATCVRHSALLASECPECGKVLDGANPAIDVCSCGERLEGSSGGTFASAVDALLVEMIAGTCDEPIFKGVGLHHVSAHLERLGAATLGWAPAKPAASGRELLAMRESGLLLARGGGEALRATLDGIVDQAPPGGCGRPGVTSAYGWIWRSWLGVPAANPLDLRLRDEVLRHAAGRGIRSLHGPRDVTLAQAGALLGAGHERTRRIVSNAGMLGGGELPGVAMALDGAKVVGIAAKLAGLLDGSAAAAALGIGRHRFRELARAGLVAADADAIGAGVLYSLDALRSLADRVAGLAPSLDHPPVGCVPVPRACRDASVPLATLLAAMLDGHLHAVARTVGEGLGSIWISVREVRRLATPLPSIRSAARDLGLHYEAARRFAGMGFFGSAPGVVDAAGVAAFGAAFCTSAQAARELGLGTRTVVARLKASGVQPTFGPPRCRQAVWRRDRIGLAKSSG